MASKNRKELYDLFQTGNKPTQDDFADLIDSTVNIDDDGIGISEKGRPIELVQQGAKKRFLDLSSAKDHPVWRVGAQSNNGDNGLNVATADDKSRVFIKRDDGLTGINNDDPKAKLHITPDTGLALQVDDTKGQSSFVLDGDGNMGIGTIIQDDYKVSIDGRVNLKGETVLSSPVRAEKGITVKGAKFNAEQGINVKNGATFENGVLEAKDGLTVNGKALIANAGATVTGLPLDAKNGLTVEKGAAIENGCLEAKEGLVVDAGAIIESGILEVKEGLNVNEGAVISSGKLEVREGLSVQGLTIFNNQLLSEGLLTAKGDVVITDGASLTADGEVTLGNSSDGQVAVDGVLRAKQGIVVEDSKLQAQAGAIVDGSELRANNGLTVHGGATVESGLLTAKEGITLPGGSDLSANGAVSLGNVESGEVTINGELLIDKGATITGSLAVPDHAILGHATIDTLDVANFNYEGTFTLDSFETNRITAGNGEIADLSITEDLDVSGQCQIADNVLFGSGMLYVTYVGPSSMTPRIKIVRGEVGEEGHFNIMVSENKLVEIVYDDESDINNFLEDWAAYKTTDPAGTNGINFIRFGTGSWQLQNMEIELISTGIPFKEFIIEEQGLRLIYVGPAEVSQFEIVANEDPESGFFEFLAEAGKLTIKYPQDQESCRVDDLIEEWQNSVINMGNTGGFEIIKIDDSAGEVLVTDVDPTDLKVNTVGDILAKTSIKTNMVTVNGHLKFDGSDVLISSVSNDKVLIENSDTTLPTQKAVKTYVDNGLTHKADQNFVLEELEKKADQTNVDTELAKKANQNFVVDELGKKADRTYVDAELAEKADVTTMDTALVGKANMIKPDEFSIGQGAVVTSEEISLTADYRGVLMVTVTAPGNSKAGLYAVCGMDSIIKIAGDGLSDQQDHADTLNVYMDEGVLMFQNALTDGVVVKATAFGG